ncbi:BTB/POZ domain-containing protein At1g21780 isoform X2 [Coffea arabica]|uniref:BTB/POZ domain-containing protein At1g21780 isoform X2 n=1 Tax=Coffea arabica TaxID=13443 RepID=A0A6P6UWL1_COFAR|nr:BTB/POZ domain-containing protein At1g21780-like isoform X2 [Coffea arabica]
MDSKVETISRLAQWRIDTFGPSTYKRSDPFKIGIWNWILSIEKNRYMYIRLFPELSRVSKEQPPVARFVLRVTTTGTNRKPYISPIHERLLRTSDDFVWTIDTTFQGRFVIDVEFLDLKICPLNGGEANPIWPSDGVMQSLATQSTLRCLSRMLFEGIHADVIINTADGTVHSHKEDFWKHRLALLGAANKYDIADLKDACEESLLEDVNTGNVLERLQEAWLYQLNKLKKGCLMYLFDFGKIYDVEDEISNFFRQADRALMVEMFQEVLTAWKPA